ncbi:hypothetical protein AAE02nite_02360 [Adhaeribacter aerolatus]|uniref:Uncharacterized protein n=1 Tax=Adhaeribacter aerolatus TaxID=670289 RepID=A0A512AS95_9BACT|nr:hypothetical protein [Adhaeribacter aerolatus]GEO02572.1 hypothetical protein AAE02nite_02360 [Adhaeribacter aerolatus]
MYYSPNAHNVPLLKKKGDKILSVAGGSSLSEVDSGLDIQAAYAITNHLGVMSNYYRASGESSGEYKEGGHGYLLEAGLGYFTPLYKEVYGFELFGGTGSGNVYNYYDEFKKSTSQINFSRHFVQAAISWENKYCKIALSHRMGLLTYNKIRTKDYNITNYPEYWNGIIRNKKYILNEPALTVQFSGYRALKAQAQIVYAVDAIDADFAQENINLNVGLYLVLPAKKKDRM